MEDAKKTKVQGEIKRLIWSISEMLFFRSLVYGLVKPGSLLQPTITFIQEVFLWFCGLAKGEDLAELGLKCLAPGSLSCLETGDGLWPYSAFVSSRCPCGLSETGVVERDDPVPLLGVCGLIGGRPVAWDGSGALGLCWGASALVSGCSRMGLGDRSFLKRL